MAFRKLLAERDALAILVDQREFRGLAADFCRPLFVSSMIRRPEGRHYDCCIRLSCAACRVVVLAFRPAFRYGTNSSLETVADSTAGRVNGRARYCPCRHKPF